MTERCTNVEDFDYNPCFNLGCTNGHSVFGGTGARTDLYAHIDHETLFHHDLSTGKSTARGLDCFIVTCCTKCVS